ncbi:MAG: hypothetical protein Q4E38_00275 [Eubacteriales bacterium]|nr:hypothetical protein [Eubacteriales bacterium]
MKAVIVEIRGRWAAALGEDGAVVRIPNAAYAPGQAVELLRSAARPARRLWKKVGSLAAAAALALSIGAGTAYALPCGTVSLEGASSLSYTVNCFDYVLDVQATDEESAALLEELDVTSLRHQRIDKALRRTVEQLESCGYHTADNEPLTVAADTQRPVHDEKLHAELEETIRRSLPAAPAVPAPGPEAQPETDTPPAPQGSPEAASPSDAQRAAPPQPENSAQPAGAIPEGPGSPAGEQPPEPHAAGFFPGPASPGGPPPQP